MLIPTRRNALRRFGLEKKRHFIRRVDCLPIRDQVKFRDIPRGKRRRENRIVIFPE